MATLTETAYTARRGIRYGAVGSILIMVLWFVGVGALNWWRAINPPPLPPPTVDFGKVANIKFPEAKIKEVEFSLQTPTGTLGRFPDRMTIFKAPNKKSGFLDPDRAIDLATRLGFLFTPAQPSESQYRWTQSDPLPAVLDVDITSEHFTLRRQWQADPSLIVLKKFVSQDQVILDASSFLRSNQILPTDVGGDEKVGFWRASGDKLVSTIALSEADFVRVEFFRKPYQVIVDKVVKAEYDFFTPDPSKGIISVLLSGATDDKNKQVIDVNYKYITVNYDQSGVYPIKTVEEAFEELKSSKGYVASLTGKSGVIRRVALGYYDSTGNQDFALPIYIFSGDNNLVAYVSALRADVIKE